MDKNGLMKIIGENLQTLRKERGLTQEQLSEMAGISTSFYANLERGNRGISVLALYKLAECLQISVDQLLHSRNADTNIQSIEALLRDKPDSFVLAIEKLIRICTDEFST